MHRWFCFHKSPPFMCDRGSPEVFLSPIGKEVTNLQPFWKDLTKTSPGTPKKVTFVSRHNCQESWELVPTSFVYQPIHPPWCFSIGEIDATHLQPGAKNPLHAFLIRIPEEIGSGCSEIMKNLRWHPPHQTTRPTFSYIFPFILLRSRCGAT